MKSWVKENLGWILALLMAALTGLMRGYSDLKRGRYDAGGYVKTVPCAER